MRSAGDRPLICSTRSGASRAGPWLPCGFPWLPAALPVGFPAGLIAGFPGVPGREEGDDPGSAMAGPTPRATISKMTRETYEPRRIDCENRFIKAAGLTLVASWNSNETDEGHHLVGNPAVSERPAAFRPTLADGLALQRSASLSQPRCHPPTFSVHLRGRDSQADETLRLASLDSAGA